MKRVMIAVDGSFLSEKTARKGYELARAMDAITSLIYVIDPRETTNNDGFAASELMKANEEEGHEMLERLKKELGDQQIWTFTEIGHPAKTIVKIAGEWGADVIVLSTHGRTGLSHLLMGSVAEYVIRHSKTPVLVIPASANSND